MTQPPTSIRLVQAAPAMLVVRPIERNLADRALDLYCNRCMAAKWIRAVRYLRSFRPSKWVLDGAAPGWSYRDQGQR